jgi:hypothetical protein
MRTRRIARRVASMIGLPNPCLDAGSAPTLARKVFHYLCHPFSPPRAGRLVSAPGGGRSSTGVKQRPERGGACRLAWRGRHSVTPFIAVSWVTNDCQREGME